MLFSFFGLSDSDVNEKWSHIFELAATMKNKTKLQNWKKTHRLKLDLVHQFFFTFYHVIFPSLTLFILFIFSTFVYSFTRFLLLPLAAEWTHDRQFFKEHTELWNFSMITHYPHPRSNLFSFSKYIYLKYSHWALTMSVPERHFLNSLKNVAKVAKIEWKWKKIADNTNANTILNLKSTIGSHNVWYLCIYYAFTMAHGSIMQYILITHSLSLPVCMWKQMNMTYIYQIDIVNLCHSTVAINTNPIIVCGTSRL